MLNLFFRKRKSKPKVMAFVDYDYWYYSYQALFHIKPNPAVWKEELETQYEIADIMVFGDFSYPKINEDLETLRSITNTIVDTAHQNKKSMTDFAMLDAVYQTVIKHKDIDTYVLFTGDGCFQSAVDYLTKELKKTVVVYGIKDSFSKQLQAAASKTVQLPAEDDVFKSYYYMIISNLDYVLDKPDIIPTFLGTVEAVSRYNSIPKEDIKMALSRMMEEGYVYQKEFSVTLTKRVKIVAANWERLIEDGLWNP